MRRPVKPFVTEYKGPNRRPTPAAGSSQRFPAEDYPFLQTPGESFARHAGESTSRPSEESYGAALRAADALFSPPHGKGAEAGLSAPRATSEDADVLDGEAGLDNTRGGRILRVIDEPPVVDLAELEADRTPKRRGRKPGSKNRRTAIIAGTDEGSALDLAEGGASGVVNGFSVGASDLFSGRSPAATTPRPRRQTAAKPSLPVFDQDHEDDQIDEDDEDDLEDDDDLVADAAVPSAAIVGEKKAATPPKRRPFVQSDLAARNEERFSWVRTKLAPGERWKRRLPKVCW